MLPYQPKYRLGHPEKQLLSLSNNILIGLEYPKKNQLNIEKKITAAHQRNFWLLPMFGWKAATSFAELLARVTTNDTTFANRSARESHIFNIKTTLPGGVSFHTGNEMERSAAMRLTNASVFKMK